MWADSGIGKRPILVLLVSKPLEELVWFLLWIPLEVEEESFLCFLGLTRSVVDPLLEPGLELVKAVTSASNTSLTRLTASPDTSDRCLFNNSPSEREAKSDFRTRPQNLRQINCPYLWQMNHDVDQNFELFVYGVFWQLDTSCFHSHAKRFEWRW